MDQGENPFAQNARGGFQEFGDDGLNDRQPFGNNEVILPGGTRGNNPLNKNFGSNNFDAEDERTSLVQQSGNPNMRQHDPNKPVGTKVELPTTSIKDPTVANPTMPPYISKFPISDRISMNFFKCFGQTMSPRSQLKQTLPLFKFEEQYDKIDKFGRQAIKLKIHETGSLELDHHMVHPFVRVHIMNLDTSKYLAKEDRSKPGVSNIESACFMDSGHNHTQAASDFLMPISTQMFDLRVKGMNLAQWEEEFVINESARYLLQPNIIFLFEILDFNVEMMFESPELLNADHLYPIAWAYLRPVGAAQIHLSRTRLQLYRYKFKYDNDIKQSKVLDPRTPPIFLEFNWPKRELYPSFLEIELQFTPKSDMILLRKHISRFPWEKEVGRVKFENIGKKKVIQDQVIIEDPLAKRQILKRWERLLGFPSELPDKMVYKFDTDGLGAMKLQFSNSGKYLAVACTLNQSSKTIIKIFDVENGELCVVLSGHHDLIHDLQWSQRDNYLLSASSDCSVKIWNLTSIRDAGDSNKEKLNYLENDSKYFVQRMLHPSFVYGASFYPDTAMESDNRLIIASVCYDQRVRLWLVPLNFQGKAQGEEQLITELSIMDKPLGGGKLSSAQGMYDEDILDDAALQLIVRPDKTTGGKNAPKQQAPGTTVFDYVHPNCMVFNSNGRLFVGDSKGQISVWDITLKNGNIQADNYIKIQHKELEGDEINQLIVHPEHENKLFVHSRDNCIRLLEYESMKGPRVRMRFFGSKCTNLMVRSCVSPDGQYMVSGSEEGVPHVWDIISGDEFGPKVTRNYECRFLDLVSDISWNPKYNMFALAGFGHTFPVMVYVYERSEEELNEILYQSSNFIAAKSSTKENNDLLKQSESKGFSQRMKATSAADDLGGKENEHFGRVNKSRGRKFGTQLAGEDATTAQGSRINSPSPIKQRQARASNARRGQQIMIEGTN